MSNEKKRYIENLASEMRSSGQNNWCHNDMLDICELAGMYENWINTVTRQEEEELSIRASQVLGVEIRHYTK